MTPASAYNHRKRWRAFAERWDAAIEEGYLRIESGLVEHAGNLFSREGPGEFVVSPPMTAAEAIHLLHMHKHKVHGLGKAPGKRWQRPKTLDEVAPSIMRKLEAFLRSREIGEEQRAQDEAEWALRRSSGDGGAVRG